MSQTFKQGVKIYPESEPTSDGVSEEHSYEFEEHEPIISENFE